MLLTAIRILTELRWDKIQKLGSYLIPNFTKSGAYEVLSYRVKLDLCDTKGQYAIYHKFQNVRFLQNNVIAYSDKAWGDGNILADYKCSPGVPVDLYQDGYRYRILISLREVKHRGDTETFQIERHIQNGFTNSTEYLQTDIDHHIHQLQITLHFPAQRHPTHVRVTDKNSSHTFDLSTKHFHRLPDNRMKVIWTIQKPRLYNSYILTWGW